MYIFFHAIGEPIKGNNNDIKEAYLIAGSLKMNERVLKKGMPN